MTISDPVRDAPGTPDASDVVTGAIGSARLRDPRSAGPEGVELDRLPTIDAAADDPGPLPSSPGSSSPGDDQRGSEETGRTAVGTAGKSSGALAEPSDIGQAPQAAEAGLPVRS
jgi:hypothetical protein